MNELMDVISGAVHDRAELRDRLARLSRWGYLTEKQGAVLARRAAPLLPGIMRIAMRSKKGSAQVTVTNYNGIETFRLTPTARVDP